MGDNVVQILLRVFRAVPLVDLYGYFSLLAGGLTFDLKPLPRPEYVTCDSLEDPYKAWSLVRVLPWDPRKVLY
jgi:hypothetical protein